MLHAAKSAVCIVLWCFAATSLAARKDKIQPIIEKVYSYTTVNQLEIGRYESEMYLKFCIDNERRNIGMRLIPFIGKQERGKRSYLGESIVRYTYAAPGITDRKEIAFYSTMPYIHSLKDVFIARTNISIYSSALLGDKLLSPMNRKNKAFYKYKKAYSYTMNGKKVTRIRIIPKVLNMQLVKGYMDVEEESGRVKTFHCEYNYNTQRSAATVEMGESGLASLLPKSMDIVSGYRFLKNSSQYRLLVDFNYSSIEPYKKENIEKTLKRNGHDLTYMYKLNTDTTATEHSTTYFDHKRTVALTAKEDSILKEFLSTQAGKDSLKTIGQDKQHRQNRKINIEDMFLGSHYVHVGLHKLVRIPPVISPSMVEWSNRKGLSLRTKLQFRSEQENGENLVANLHLGYNFKRKEFYWKTPTYILFAPRHNGTLHLEMGNGNRIYNSTQAEEVRERLSKDMRYDSLLTVFNQYAFNYYNDLYAKAALSYELLNGLTTRLGLVYHERKLIGWNEEAGKNGIDKRYRSMAPNVYLEWTPGQYFYREGNSKKVIFSKWPTFSAEYEKGITALNCHNKYERWELEAKHRIDLYALRKLYLRIGGGLYTDKSNTHFVDYSNFHYSSLPNSWDDSMNGQFESLDSRWYNESEYYARACASYESPMLLFSCVRPLTQYIKRERIYCNLLSVHALNPYTEIGYSIATHLFDIGLFIGSANRKSVSFGWSFALKIFED